MATKPPRLYVPLDATYTRDPKVMGLTVEAELLWIRLICEAKLRPDRLGFLTKSDVKSAAGEQIKSPILRANQLVTAGLLKPSTMGRVQGYQIASWLAWNMDETEADKARQARITGGLVSAHLRGQHKKNPSEACPKCPAGSSTTSSAASSTREEEEKSKTSSSIPPLPPARGSAPRGTGGAGGNWTYPDDWDGEAFRPRDYLWTPTEPQFGGWQGPGCWVDPAIWRDGWSGKGRRPERTTPTVDELEAGAA